MNILLSLDKALSLHGDREALVDGEVRLTYGQFGKRVARLANGLKSLGAGPESVAAIIAPNCHEYMETYYACAVDGVVLNPINFRLSPREIGHILQDSGASVLFCHRDFAEQALKALEAALGVRAVIWIGDEGETPRGIECRQYERLLSESSDVLPTLPTTQSDALAHLYYTSGTTGKPKGVMLTHGNVSFHALSAIGELSLTDSDTWAHVAPMFHLADAWATFAMTWVGARHVFVPYFRAKDVLAVIERERVTITNLIPTMLNAMVNDPDVGGFDYGSLRAMLSGGAPIAPETVRKIVGTFGCDYIQTYGMTETSPYLTLSILKDHMSAWPPERQLEVKSRTGRPFAGVNLKVVRADGDEVAWDDCEVGEIIVSGPTVTPGYWKQPDATAAAIEGGWLHTGDLAVVDTEGYVNIVDRKKDMIITGGENVYSTEVEHVLYEHPAVLECAVIGLPDKDWGEAVTAVVVTRDGYSAAEGEIIEFVRERLARYKCPKTVAFVPELPKTGSGKITKAALKERYAGAQSATGSNGGGTDAE